MIENNIIQSLGAGSGIDTRNLVTQLTEIEGSATQSRIDTAREKAELQISDFGLIKSALADLQTAADALVDPEGLFSKSASFTDSDALVPTDLDTDVLTGSYAFEVTSLAQSQSLSSALFNSETDAVGEGTLTFNFGAWDGGLSSFAADASQGVQTITIDSSNNTLQGLRDAINDQDFGVQASIVQDGSGYRFLITASSGESSQLEITVSESETTPSNNDDAGLSRFAFNTGGSQLTQNQAGTDATLKINGLEISRASNTVDDVVDGLSLDLLKASPGEIVTVTVADDKTFAEQTIRDFVDAYNNFLSIVEPAVGFDEETDERGSLASDSLAKSILSQIRSDISSVIPGLSDTNFTTIATVGIQTENDGTISIDDDTFSDALDENFEEIQSLFAPKTQTSAADMTVNSFGSATQAGEYAVVVTTTPTKGAYAGGAVGSNISFPLDTSALGGVDYSFAVSVNGEESSTLTVPEGVYSSGSELAAALQATINGDSNLSANGASVVVSYDTDHFDITSNKYGTQSSVSFTAVGADLGAGVNSLGITATSGSSGRDAAGTVDGEVGFGLGQVLLPALGSDAEGLTMLVGESATGATVNFSRGFAGELSRLIDEFLSSTGLIVQREQNLGQQVDDLESDQELLDRRLSIFEERMTRQFIAMESILSGLNSSGNFLENLISSLPFTSDDN